MLSNEHADSYPQQLQMRMVRQQQLATEAQIPQVLLEASRVVQVDTEKACPSDETMAEQQNAAQVSCANIASP